MSITRAFLLTLLITAIEAVIQVISFVGFDTKNNPESVEHVYGITIILCRIIAYSTVFYFFWRKDLKLEKVKFSALNPRILFFLLLLTLGLRFIGEPFWDFNKIFGSGNRIDGPYIAEINANFLYRALLTLLVAPVLEELFFRKFLLPELLEKHTKFTAVTVSAILFAAIHWESPENWVPAFIFGIVSGIIFLETRKISYVILLHFIYNFLGITVNLNGAFYFELIQWLNYGLGYWVLFASGISLTLFCTKQIAVESKKKLGNDLP